MIYCDSSFLTSLYVSSDLFNPHARKAASRFSVPIPYTLLNELEFFNALQRGLGSRSLDQTSYDWILRDVTTDEANGLLERTSVNQIKLYEQARALSKRHTPRLGCRSLDILHVASALILGAKKFASFDLRQRKLAQAVGLPLIPQSLPK